MPKLVQLLFNWINWKPYKVSQQEWESQYQSGRWEYLRQLNELAHYSIIAGYFYYLKSGGSLLDIGCGEGLLQERLGSGSYSHYIGIDLSAGAIARAAHKNDTKTQFICTDVNGYIPGQCFDAIVFNEVLYYFDEPLNVLKQYESYLNKDGVFIISMFMNEKAPAIWNQLESFYQVLDGTKLTNIKSGNSWICKVCKNRK